MMRKTERIGLVVLLILAGGLVYTAWKLHVAPQSTLCRVCHRHLHGGSEVIVLWNEKREAFCCPTCASTFRRQEDREVKVVELTDFKTGFKVAPEEAYAVEGSNVNPCLQHPVLMDSQKQAAPMDYDRCSPSILVSPTCGRPKNSSRSMAADCSASRTWLPNERSTARPGSSVWARLVRSPQSEIRRRPCWAPEVGRLSEATPPDDGASTSGRDRKGDPAVV